jgi:cytochrome P450
MTLHRVSPPTAAIPFPAGYTPASSRAEARERDRSMVAFDEAIGTDIARVRFWGRDPILVSRDEWVHTVMVEEADAFHKGPLLTVNARPLLGNGLLVSDNELNKRQRRVISPAFAHKRVADYASIVSRYTLRETDRWQDGQVIDLPQEMLAITMGIIGEILLGDDLLREAGGVGRAIVTLMNFAIDETRAPLRAVTGLPRALAALVYLNNILRRRIRERLRSGDADGADEADLLTRLLFGHGGGEEESPMPPRLARDETMTLFLAGFETVALALVWSLYLLATHPEADARVRAEAESLIHTPTYDDLPRLPYTLQVFKEALRLYPPVYIVARQAIRSVKAGPYELPRGTVVFVSPYVQHRRPDVFPDPLRFDPDRWAAPDAERRLPGRYAFVPFGGGPHVCVGGHFALMEGHLILALLARRFTLRPVAGQTVMPEPLFTLRPRYGLRMIVERRV